MAVNGTGVSNLPLGNLAIVQQYVKESKEPKVKESNAHENESVSKGLIKNQNGEDMIELSSVIDERGGKKRYDKKEPSAPQYTRNIFETIDSDEKEMKAYKERKARMESLRNKMLQGHELTGDEKGFLRKYYPKLASTAERMEMEARTLKQKLHACKSSESAEKVYRDAKMNALSNINENDSSGVFLMIAIDQAYDEHTGKKITPKTEIDVSA